MSVSHVSSPHLGTRAPSRDPAISGMFAAPRGLLMPTELPERGRSAQSTVPRPPALADAVTGWVAFRRETIVCRQLSPANSGWVVVVSGGGALGRWDLMGRTCQCTFFRAAHHHPPFPLGGPVCKGLATISPIRAPVPRATRSIAPWRAPSARCIMSARPRPSPHAPLEHSPARFYLWSPFVRVPSATAQERGLRFVPSPSWRTQ